MREGYGLNFWKIEAKGLNMLSSIEDDVKQGTSLRATLKVKGASNGFNLWNGWRRFVRFRSFNSLISQVFGKLKKLAG